MKKYLFLLIGVAFISQSCMNDDCDNCYNPPAAFGFTLTPAEGETSLIPEKYKLDTISLYYFDGNIKKEVGLRYGTSYYLGISLVTTDISVISAGKNIKKFYLYLNQNDTDTIHFSCKLENDGCCTNYIYDSLSYNGKKMLYHQISGLLYVVKPQTTLPTIK